LIIRSHLATRDLVLRSLSSRCGANFVPIKVALVEVPPFALAALRFLLAALPLVFFVRRPAMPWRYVIGYGFAIGAFQFGLLFLGMKLGMPAGLSSLVIQMQVFCTIGLAVALEGDRCSDTPDRCGDRRRDRAAGRAEARRGDGHNAGRLPARHRRGLRVGRRQHHRQARRRRARARHVRAGRLVEPRAAAAAGGAVGRIRGRAAWHAVASAGVLTWGCVLFLAWVAALFGFAS
jgi:hypothetical protein